MLISNIFCIYKLLEVFSKTDCLLIIIIMNTKQTIFHVPLELLTLYYQSRETNTFVLILAWIFSVDIDSVYTSHLQNFRLLAVYWFTIQSITVLWRWI